MKSVAIIGFGFCGRMSLFHLAEKFEAGDKIYVFDKNPLNDLGPAFSAFSPYYILNVPVAKMSAFSDRQDEFKNFLAAKYPKILEFTSDNGFAPRQIYGEYLQQLTIEALRKLHEKNIHFEFIQDEVFEIKKDGENFIVKSEEMTREASQILLATSFKQNELSYNFSSENFVKKLWSRAALPFHEKKFEKETICLIGSGLTAVDIIIGLKNKNFAGKIIVISRRGNFPKKHFTPESSSLLQSSEDLARLVDELKLMGSSALQAKDDGGNVVLAMCLKIRKFLRENPEYDLRHVIDSIRPITQKLWQNFDEKNKKLFLRFWPYWNIFRHRAPISSLETIEKMQALGQIELRKKGVKNITKLGERFLVGETMCDVLVNALGFDLKAQSYPLLKQMIESGLLKDEILLASSNDKNLHLLGGLNIGRDFECTAVPDLRSSVESTIEKL